MRHLLTKRLASGERAYFWNPSKTIRALGMSAEPLGKDEQAAKARAVYLNGLADDLRRGNKPGENGPRPGTFGLMVEAFKASEEFGELKPRTQKDYAYYLGKIDAEFGAIPIPDLTPRVIKTYYKRVSRESGKTWGYHILGTFRVVMSWGVSEDWMTSNPALDVKLTAPKRRTVIWAPDQAAAYIAHAKALGWKSIAAMAHVFDSIGQSPVDVRTLLRRAYDGRCIDVTRAKTGRTDAPIPLFPEAKKALDAYLSDNPRLPDAPLFINDAIGGMWNENTLQKKHRLIRKAAKLPSNLQLQDFRTTAQTEGGAASGTVDELRGLARHSTRDAGEHYVIPDARFVESIQSKRLAHRNKKGR